MPCGVTNPVLLEYRLKCGRNRSDCSFGSRRIWRYAFHYRRGVLLILLEGPGCFAIMNGGPNPPDSGGRSLSEAARGSIPRPGLQWLQSSTGNVHHSRKLRSTMHLLRHSTEQYIFIQHRRIPLHLRKRSIDHLSTQGRSPPSHECTSPLLAQFLAFGRRFLVTLPLRSNLLQLGGAFRQSPSC